MDIKTLDKEIISLKETLYKLISGSNLTDENVVRCSQKLDKLITKYEKYKSFIKIQ